MALKYIETYSAIETVRSFGLRIVYTDETERNRTYARIGPDIRERDLKGRTFEEGVQDIK